MENMLNSHDMNTTIQKAPLHSKIHLNIYLHKNFDTSVV